MIPAEECELDPEGLADSLFCFQAPWEMSPGSPGGGRQTSAGAEGKGAFELNLEGGQGILGSKTGRERHLRQGANMSEGMRNCRTSGSSLL